MRLIASLQMPHADQLAEAPAATATAATPTETATAPTASTTAPATTAAAGLLWAAGHSARSRVEHIGKTIGNGFEAVRHAAGNIT